MRVKDWRLSTKLWTGVGVLVAAIVAVVVTVSAQSALTSRASEAAIRARTERLFAASLWAGLVETDLTRAQAMFIARDPILQTLYLVPMAEGRKRMAELEASIVEKVSDARERALLDAVMALRREIEAAFEEAQRLREAGDEERALAVLEARYTPRIPAYLHALREFADYQRAQLATVQAYYESKRRQNMIFGSTAMGLLVLGILIGAWGLIRHIRQPLQRTVSFASTLAGGDLTYALDTRRRDEFGEMTRALETMRGELAALVREVRHASTQLQETTEEIAHGNQDLSDRTERAASNLQEAAANMEALTERIREAAASARRASEQAQALGQRARESDQAVAQLVATMEAIRQSSDRIAAITAVIDGIAFQTNILALNAAVEAARAGEAGRGFAVVAGEVLGLAQRSAEAAREIRGLIEHSVADVQQGTHQVEQARATIERMRDEVHRLGESIAEGAQASQEQANGVDEMNEAIGQLDRMTQQNAALVEEIAAAALAMREQATHLTASVERFRVPAA